MQTEAVETDTCHTHTSHLTHPHGGFTAFIAIALHGDNRCSCYGPAAATPPTASTTTASSAETITSSGTYYFRSRSASGCWGPQGSVTVTITTPSEPDVIINSTNNIFCGIAPSPITYTATSLNGGSSPNYQWFLNDVSVQNSSSNTYTVSSPQNGDLVFCVLTSNLSCVTNSTDTSSAIITTSFLANPTNDNCTSATSVNINSVISGSTGCATASAGMPGVCFGTADDDVWYPHK